MVGMRFERVDEYTLRGVSTQYPPSPTAFFSSTTEILQMEFGERTRCHAIQD